MHISTQRDFTFNDVLKDTLITMSRTRRKVGNVSSNYDFGYTEFGQNKNTIGVGGECISQIGGVRKKNNGRKKAF